MSRAAYYLRVFFISIEFLAFVIAIFIYYLWSAPLLDALSNIKLNKDALGYIIALPGALIIWLLNKGRSVIFPDSGQLHLLHEWPDYWKLKAHFNVGLFQGTLGFSVCFIFWLTNKIEQPVGQYVFLSGLIIMFICTYSFYNANIILREYLIRAKD